MRPYLSAVNGLIAINLLVFFASQSQGSQLLDSLALYFPKNEHFALWQLVSHMFMHAGFAHILFNMFALWMFGTPLEQMWGRSRFLLFYFISGMGAAIFYTAIHYVQFNATYTQLIDNGVSPEIIRSMLETASYPAKIISEETFGSFYQIFHTPMVGASGAIYGVLVAFAFLFPNTKLMLIFLPVPIAAKYFIPAIIALDLFSGVTGFSIFGGGVAHFAHVGGALIGFLLMMYWKITLPRIRY